ncbi:hypothetical protein [Chryseobacterium gregarium]|uniref:hypothetical protein n=1 Tax=Chryseobacterium gregarium TaxID=456299 RepID=UPI0021CD64C7|nr:hypothetical protein [Chryseobacterium gregarium]
MSGSAKSHYDSEVRASLAFYQTYVKNPNQYFTGFDVNNYLVMPLVVYNNK